MSSHACSVGNTHLQYLPYLYLTSYAVKMATIELSIKNLAMVHTGSQFTFEHDCSIYDRFIRVARWHKGDSAEDREELIFMYLDILTICSKYLARLHS